MIVVKIFCSCLPVYFYCALGRSVFGCYFQIFMLSEMHALVCMKWILREKWVRDIRNRITEIQLCTVFFLQDYLLNLSQNLQFLLSMSNFLDMLRGFGPPNGHGQVDVKKHCF